MNMSRPPSNLHLIADCKAHYLKIRTPNGEQAYMFYALVPGPSCKMFLLFVNKLNITDLETWTANIKPNSPIQWIAHSRNINAESLIKKELLRRAKQLKSNLVKLGLLNRGSKNGH
jgi:hypothetical protein